MQSITVFALFGLFAAALLAGGLMGLCLLIRRPKDVAPGNVSARRR
ncbi:hypothetical protein [Terrihabitans soli]|nr:hypothetical protein [Terrihabitans soli]